MSDSIEITEHEGFKVGDTVIVTTKEFEDPEGTTGKVTSFHQDRGDTFIFVTKGAPPYDNFPYMAGELERRTFRVGDRVKVAAEAETAHGDEVYFGGEIVGEVIEEVNEDGDIGVRADYGLDQVVGPQYLMLLAEDPAEVAA
ncbi:hypothetical protein [Streptomyces sp. NBC_01198]|uniref:hypothetical protein n=1 Tax=Streptomyces sp. NBC_01198 TaxID=2903769 RepID=UPI002E0D634E|nr:hypothetical protein OG702_32250 [Streptomyces sp. NBC_01198]